MIHHDGAEQRSIVMIEVRRARCAGARASSPFPCHWQTTEGVGSPWSSFSHRAV